jgi:hypothetical protein
MRCLLPDHRNGPTRNSRQFHGQQRLVAVLTHLGDQYGGASGHWYLETGFGRLDGPNHPTYATLDAAQDWLSQRLAH